jgi:pimeloyl-ACP methyl ester carboxylesterase
MKIIRRLFGVGEVIAPRLSGRLAFELFCRTPKKDRLTKGERRAIDSARGFMAEARHHRLKAGSHCIAMHEFRPENVRAVAGTVLVIHGWNSRTEYMKALIEGFRHAGHRVIALDLPGHGQSTGRRLTMVSAVDAVRLASEWFGPFKAVVGHSFGGAVAANAAVASIRGIEALAVDRLILIAAPASLPAMFERYGKFLNLGPRSQAVVADQVERIAGRPLSDFVGGVQLASAPIQTLVIHARDDREVSADDAANYASAGDHVRLHWADGLGHRRILSNPGVVDEAVRFAVGQLQPSLVVTPL